MFQDQNLWREKGPIALLAFISNATGDDYDIVAYDTQHDYDPHNPDAVRYIASLALSKAEPIINNWRRFKKSETFHYRKPNDGSVAEFGSFCRNDAVCAMRQSRLQREAEANNARNEDECVGLHVPDTDRYYDAISNALHNRDIPILDMSATEKRKQKWDDVRATINEYKAISGGYRYLIYAFLPLSIWPGMKISMALGIFCLIMGIIMWHFIIREMHEYYLNLRKKHTECE